MNFVSKGGTDGTDGGIEKTGMPRWMHSPVMVQAQKASNTRA